MFIETLNPASGKILKQYPLISDHKVQEQIKATELAYLAWRRLSIKDRVMYIQRLMTELDAAKIECAELIMQEMGKPIKFAVTEIEKCILVCEYYCRHAADYLANHKVETEFHSSFVTYNPLGIILAVMPWNFPFWQVFRFLIPCLIAGNAVLLKHASIVTGCGQMIQELFKRAQFPENLFKHLLIRSQQVDAIIENPYIRGITLTGSEGAGRHIASHAGQNLKKVVLELGGNDACVVLNDADIKLAAKSIVSSRLRNSGQVCVATKRVIVEKGVHQALIEALESEMSQYQMQDPSCLESNLGPLARSDLRDTLHQQVQVVIEQGAKLVCGGYLPSGPGFFYPPTLLDEVASDSLIYQEELFGPVIAVSIAEDLDQAIQYANATRFGLGGSIFSSNLDLASRYAQEHFESGLCYVNMPVTSDPRLPFGGIKDSGYGRELSREGILEFVNIKTVIIHE